jgi:DNA-directed RNA polymerase specialized sigma24 family protein
MRQEQPLFAKRLLLHLDGAYNLASWLVERDQDARAVVQEAYIQALKEIVGFRGADVRAWLLTSPQYHLHLDSEMWLLFKHDRV